MGEGESRGRMGGAAKRVGWVLGREGKGLVGQGEGGVGWGGGVWSKAISLLYTILQGAADQCKFIVRQVTDRPLLKYGVVTLESAIHPGWSIAITSRGKTRNYKKSPESPSTKMDEIRFVVRAEVRETV